MNEIDRDHIDASGDLSAKCTVSSQEVRRERTADVMTIDSNNQHAGPRHAAGPRTEIGKRRSSKNAIKHGIFSEATLLKNESRRDFESLRAQLWESLQPVGGVEELLVDKLVSISWRHGRLLAAEKAEIQKYTEFLEWDERSRQKEEADEILHGEFSGTDTSLISKIRNPEILECCLELLTVLRDGIKTEGLHDEHDTALLEKIYGKQTTLRETPRDDYQIWSQTAKTSEEERIKNRYATPGECKLEIVDRLDKEIKRLKLFQKKQASLESRRMKLEIVRRGVPETPELDRLLRYEASLERAFDRTLVQLERLQRLRLGQPVAPRIDVNVS